ncbi:UNVERIFIED_CONTAM: hypothetical protein HDU68_000562 [Siphonaria sp. JEL0065]|nr:hypothetical protein HDU68_000562 [Siphonaria sp. JEL0065]
MAKAAASKERKIKAAFEAVEAEISRMAMESVQSRQARVATQIANYTEKYEELLLERDAIAGKIKIEHGNVLKLNSWFVKETERICKQGSKDSETFGKLKEISAKDNFAKLLAAAPSLDEAPLQNNSVAVSNGAAGTRQQSRTTSNQSSQRIVKQEARNQQPARKDRVLNSVALNSGVAKNGQGGGQSGGSGDAVERLKEVNRDDSQLQLPQSQRSVAAPASRLTGNDNSGGDRKSAKFNAAHLPSTQLASARDQSQAPVLAPIGERQIESPSPDPKRHRLASTPAISDPEQAVREKLAAIGGTSEAVDEVLQVAQLDFDNCSAPNSDGAERDAAEEAWEDGVDPDEFGGDPNSVDSADESETGDEEAVASRKRPENRYVGPDAAYVNNITCHCVNLTGGVVGLQVCGFNQKTRHSIKAPSASFQVENDIRHNREPNPMHSTAPDIVVMALHESFPKYKLTCPECGTLEVKPKGWADAPRGIYDLNGFFVFFARGSFDASVYSTQGR